MLLTIVMLKIILAPGGIQLVPIQLGGIQLVSIQPGGIQLVLIQPGGIQLVSIGGSFDPARRRKGGSSLADHLFATLAAPTMPFNIQ